MGGGLKIFRQKKMYFQGWTSAGGGGTSLGPKMGTSVGWGDWQNFCQMGRPPVPPGKKCWDLGSNIIGFHSQIGENNCFILYLGNSFYFICYLSHDIRKISEVIEVDPRREGQAANIFNSLHKNTCIKHHYWGYERSPKDIWDLPCLLHLLFWFHVSNYRNFWNNKRWKSCITYFSIMKLFHLQKPLSKWH